MKSIRIGYLIGVMALACAQLAIAFSFWGTPALVSGGETVKAYCFIALVGGWLIAVFSDLALSAYEVLPLSFAGEAVLAIISLAILAVLPAGVFYGICAALAPILILAKGATELAHGPHELQHI